MAKEKTAGKSAKQKLAEGAAAIRKAEKAANKGGAGKNGNKKNGAPAPLQLVESTRDIADIIKDRVTILPGSIGIKMDDGTPLEETLRVFDYVTTLSDHVGFMIGDVLNFGETKFGTKYDQAMVQTGRARSTLKGYSEASRKIAPDHRIAALSFSHHREIVRLEDASKRNDLLKEVGKAAEKGRAPTTKELRYKVQKMQPRKAKAKKATGKGKKKAKPAAPPYEPNAEETAMIDGAYDKVSDASTALDSDLRKLLLKVNNNTKREWSKLLKPFCDFSDELYRKTGY